uniref:Alpha-carbonic anhydrase domain-containing protein n=1 Tax=Denticeps clupeoides TaxID=299321 RepID=A0AAY4C608_9TELE
LLTPQLHIVHYNSELYVNMSMAKMQRDGLAVLGVLIEVKVAIPAFDIRALLPKDLGRYFRYNGSLTTPPCYQSVLWTVFQETVMISETQLACVSRLLSANEAGDCAVFHASGKMTRWLQFSFLRCYVLDD